MAGLSRSADLGARKMLRDARTTALVKLRRGVVTQSQGRLWAEVAFAQGFSPEQRYDSFTISKFEG